MHRLLRRIHYHADLLAGELFGEDSDSEPPPSPTESEKALEFSPTQEARALRAGADTDDLGSESEEEEEHGARRVVDYVEDRCVAACCLLLAAASAL